MLCPPCECLCKGTEKQKQSAQQHACMLVSRHVSHAGVNSHPTFRTGARRREVAVGVHELHLQLLESEARARCSSIARNQRYGVVGKRHLHAEAFRQAPTDTHDQEVLGTGRGYDAKGFGAAFSMPKEQFLND